MQIFLNTDAVGFGHIALNQNLGERPLFLRFDLFLKFFDIHFYPSFQAFTHRVQKFLWTLSGHHDHVCTGTIVRKHLAVPGINEPPIRFQPFLPDPVVLRHFAEFRKGQDLQIPEVGTQACHGEDQCNAHEADPFFHTLVPFFFFFTGHDYIPPVRASRRWKTRSTVMNTIGVTTAE
ncbi:MAG: hypothetical protein BWY09_01790 [Candidatus Hydrogenedentes bacterium ADurb.Bin179]|nr:MAG: hypothetical protein BWY09_01790 [Candidatus Hydrogenedentes bacterium ADurb.Bin179]